MYISGAMFEDFEEHTALIFLDIFSIKCCTVLMAPPMIFIQTYVFIQTVQIDSGVILHDFTWFYMKWLLLQQNTSCLEVWVS